MKLLYYAMMASVSLAPMMGERAMSPCPCVIDTVEIGGGTWSFIWNDDPGYGLCDDECVSETFGCYLNVQVICDNDTQNTLESRVTIGGVTVRGEVRPGGVLWVDIFDGLHCGSNIKMQLGSYICYLWCNGCGE